MKIAGEKVAREQGQLFGEGDIDFGGFAWVGFTVGWRGVGCAIDDGIGKAFQNQFFETGQVVKVDALLLAESIYTFGIATDEADDIVLSS